MGFRRLGDALPGAPGHGGVRPTPDLAGQRDQRHPRPERGGMDARRTRRRPGAVVASGARPRRRGRRVARQGDRGRPAPAVQAGVPGGLSADAGRGADRRLLQPVRGHILRYPQARRADDGPAAGRPTTSVRGTAATTGRREASSRARAGGRRSSTRWPATAHRTTRSSYCATDQVRFDRRRRGGTGRRYRSPTSRRWCSARRCATSTCSSASPRSAPTRRGPTAAEDRFHAYWASAAFGALTALGRGAARRARARLLPKLSDPRPVPSSTELLPASYGATCARTGSTSAAATS